MRENVKQDKDIEKLAIYKEIINDYKKVKKILLMENVTSKYSALAKLGIDLQQAKNFVKQIDKEKQKCFKEQDIESLLTKEQMARIEYKVEEDK